MKKLLLCSLLAACTAPDSAARNQNTACSEPARLAALPAEINEASGLAISNRHPDILWVHNDSGEPVIFGLDTLGNIRARVRIDGTLNDDWEDIAVAPCGDQSCLYIGAIGDNRHGRTDRAIYIVPEPLLTETAATPVRTVRFRLADGAQDAEALFVTPTERIYLITKGRAGPISLYEFPQQPGETVIARRMQALTSGLVQLPEMVTAAAASSDGRHVLVRTYSALQLFSFEAGRLSPVEGTAFSLTALAEPQGEGADIADDGTVYLVSERGPSNEPAALSRVQCDPVG